MSELPPQAADLFRRLGLDFTVVQRLTSEQLGSSPGDIMWTGDRFLVERTCPMEWVLHDVAHWIECRRNRPEDLHTENFGFDRLDLHTQVGAESQTCWIATQMAIRLGYPYQKAAVETGLQDLRNEDWSAVEARAATYDSYFDNLALIP